MTPTNQQGPATLVPVVPAQSDVALVLSDETGDQRTDDELRALERELREVAQRHGYDLSSWGATGTEVAEAALDAQRALHRLGILARLRPDFATAVVSL